MQPINKEKPRLNNWEITKLLWKAQILGNVLFGFPLVAIIFFYNGFSLSAIMNVGILYFWIYVLIFIPFFALLPIFPFRSAKKTFNRIYQGEKVEKKEVLQATEVLLNVPARVFFIILIVVPLGFALGVFILRLGLISEFMPAINVLMASGMAIGFSVAAIQAFLNYIFLEVYLRPLIEFLVSLYPQAIRRELRIRKFPLFLKIFFLVLFTAIAIQASLAALFLSKIAISFPQELKNSLISAGLLVALALIYVFLIATIFTRNLVYPLKKLIFWAREVTKKKLDEDIYVITNDEVSDAIDYTRHMVEGLKETEKVLEIKVRTRTKELKQLADTLEEKVQQRTGELHKRVKELEDFQKLTVGREVKMIELKKKIKELKEKKG